MTMRPTQRWQQQVSDEAAQVAAGTLAPDEASAVQLWPPAFIAQVDAVLADFEDIVRTRLGGGGEPTDDAVWSTVEHVVEDLNHLDDEHGRIETEEREDLCEYIDAVLTAAGVDVAALTVRHGVDRSELTDDWREW